jgi:hypothetical protein
MPVIENHPFGMGPYTFLLRDVQQAIGFDVNAIGNVEASIVCGLPSVEIVDVANAGLPAIFSVTDNELVINYSEDHSFAGTHVIRVRYFNSRRPTVFALSTSFQVKIVDGCNPPAGWHTPLSVHAPSF